MTIIFNNLYFISVLRLDSEAMLLAIVTYLAISTHRVLGELGISQSSVVHHLHVLSKSVQNCWIVPPVHKILQNFWLTLMHMILSQLFLLIGFNCSIYLEPTLYFW